MAKVVVEHQAADAYRARCIRRSHEGGDGGKFIDKVIRQQERCIAQVLRPAHQFDPCFP